MDKTSSAQRTGAGRSRKQGAPAPINHYKVLGVRVNATPKSIKEGYFAKVKEFPGTLSGGIPEHSYGI